MNPLKLNKKRSTKLVSCTSKNSIPLLTPFFICFRFYFYHFEMEKEPNWTPHNSFSCTQELRELISERLTSIRKVHHTQAHWLIVSHERSFHGNLSSARKLQSLEKQIILSLSLSTVFLIKPIYYDKNENFLRQFLTRKNNISTLRNGIIFSLSPLFNIYFSSALQIEPSAKWIYEKSEWEREEREARKMCHWAVNVWHRQISR